MEEITVVDEIVTVNEIVVNNDIINIPATVNGKTLQDLILTSSPNNRVVQIDTGEDIQILAYCPFCYKPNVFVLAEEKTKYFCRNIECFKNGDIETYFKEKADQIPVNWHLDYTSVSWKDDDKKGAKHTCTLREFKRDYQGEDEEEIPEIRIQPLHVQENVEAILEHYNIIIKSNIITNKVDTFKDGKMLQGIEIVQRYILDCCIKHDFKLGKDELFDLLVSISRKNEYNPFEEYLISVREKFATNPSVLRVSALQQLKDSITSDTPKKELYIEKYLVQLITLALSEEDSTIAGQYMLVLQGKQGLGKSTWFRNLLPKHMRPKYFLGGRTLDPKKTDDIIQTMSCLLVELGEISSTFKKADIETIKAYVTEFKDRLRKPYGKEDIDKKRRTSLCATTNDTEYLRDETGSRRFLTITCEDIDYNHDIDVDQLWAEVYELYLSGYSYYFTPDENDEITKANEPFKVKSKEQQQLELYYDLFPQEQQDGVDVPFLGKWYTSKEIGAYLENMRNSNPQDERIATIKIGQILNKITGVRTKVARGNKTLYLLRLL